MLFPKITRKRRKKLEIKNVKNADLSAEFTVYLSSTLFELHFMNCHTHTHEYSGLMGLGMPVHIVKF